MTTTTTELATTTPQTNLPLIQAAMDKGLTPEQLEKLIGLQERVIAHNARQAYTQAMNKLLSELRPIYKGAANSHTKKTYATLEGVLDVLQPLCNAHGFTLAFTEEEGAEPGWVALRLDIAHIGGHGEFKRGRFPLDDSGSKGGSNKTLIQAVGSAFSYGRRYLLGLAFNLVFTDDRGKSEDNDGNRATETPEEKIISEAQVEFIAELIERKGTELQRFLRWANCGHLTQLTVGQFNQACKMLSTKPDKGGVS